MNLSIVLYEFLKVFTSFLPILIPITAIILFFVKPERLLNWFIFLVGFQALFVDVGVSVTIPRVFLLFSIITLIVYKPVIFFSASKKYPAKEILYILLIFLLGSIVFNMPFFPEKNVFTAYWSIDDGLFRDRFGREISQFLMFLLRVSIPLVVMTICVSSEKVKNVIKTLLVGTTVICLYGLYQLIAFAYSLPAIYIFRGAFRPAGDIGAFNTQWGKILRISSLTGEPKDLAGLLMPVVFLLGAFLWFLPPGKRYWGVERRVIVWILFILHILVFVFTFSTAGWLAFVFSLIVIIPATQFSLSNIRKIIPALLFSFVLIFVVLSSSSVQEILQVRFFDRLTAEFLSSPDYGASQLIHMYRNYPHTIFMGASLGGALFYEQYVEQPESIIYYLFDFGILGTIIFLLFVWLGISDVWKKVETKKQHKNPLARSLMLAVVLSVPAMIVFPKLDATFMFWVVFGIYASLAFLDESTLT